MTFLDEAQINKWLVVDSDPEQGIFQNVHMTNFCLVICML